MIFFETTCPTGQNWTPRDLILKWSKENGHKIVNTCLNSTFVIFEGRAYGYDHMNFYDKDGICYIKVFLRLKEG